MSITLSSVCSLLAFNTGFLIFLIFYITYKLNPSFEEGKAIALLSLICSLFVLGQFFLLNSKTLVYVVGWQRFQHIILSWLIFVWLHFVFTILDKEENPYYWFILIVSIIFSILFLTDIIIKPNIFEFRKNFFAHKYKPAYLIFTLILMGNIIYGYILLVKSLKAYFIPILVGITIALLSGMLVLVGALQIKPVFAYQHLFFEYGLIIMCLSIAYSMLVKGGLVEKERIRKIFGSYMSKNVAKKILEDSDGVLDGKLEYTTILFADIRNFTGLSEKLTPKELVALLNENFKYMVDIIHSNSGIVNKFIGDSIVAIFGTIKVDQEKHALNALNAAFAIQKRISRRKDKNAIKVGIGIATGEVLAGNIGSSHKLEYTVIGDAVNTASRLSSNAKPDEILITEETYNLVKDYISADYKELLLTLKGKEYPSKTYSIVISM